MRLVRLVYLPVYNILHPYHQQMMYCHPPHPKLICIPCIMQYLVVRIVPIVHWMNQTISPPRLLRHIRINVKEVVVTSLSDFGAFVEVCDGQGEASGLEGLVHISEISWNRISHPRDAVKVGQREFVKVLEVNDETGRINFSIKQTQADPLMETLETIMPVTMPEPSIDEDDLSEIPLPGLPDICSSLLKEDGIEAVIPGRQAMEQRVVSQDLELWLTNVFVEDGYNLLARAGRQVQEIHVVTRLDRDAIKRAIKRATSVAKSQ